MDMMIYGPSTDVSRMIRTRARRYAASDMGGGDDGFLSRLADSIDSASAVLDRVRTPTRGQVSLSDLFEVVSMAVMERMEERGACGNMSDTMFMGVLELVAGKIDAVIREESGDTGHAMRLVIEIEGETLSDLEQGLEEASARVATGCVMGFDSNDTGRFSFERFGEENPPDDDEE